MVGPPWDESSCIACRRKLRDHFVGLRIAEALLRAWGASPVVSTVESDATAKDVTKPGPAYSGINS